MEGPSASFTEQWTRELGLGGPRALNASPFEHQWA